MCAYCTYMHSPRLKPPPEIPETMLSAAELAPRMAAGQSAIAQACSCFVMQCDKRFMVISGISAIFGSVFVGCWLQNKRTVC